MSKVLSNSFKHLPLFLGEEGAIKQGGAVSQNNIQCSLHVPLFMLGGRLEKKVRNYYGRIKIKI